MGWLWKKEVAVGLDEGFFAFHNVQESVGHVWIVQPAIAQADFFDSLIVGAGSLINAPFGHGAVGVDYGNDAPSQWDLLTD